MQIEGLNSTHVWHLDEVTWYASFALLIGKEYPIWYYLIGTHNTATINILNGTRFLSKAFTMIEQDTLN